MIDLRSDTVTKPTPAMRRAMAEAEVGDDVYGEDPTVNRLQQKAAELCGKEAALFVPSGTMGNTIGLKVNSEHGQEIVCDARAHILNYELSMLAWFCGCVPRAVPTANGVLTWKAIHGQIRALSPHWAPTGVIALENTHNAGGGSVYPQDVLDEICHEAHKLGVPVHLDGARVFNAAAASGSSVARIARDVDTITFCLSKGLGAPVGSLLAGSQATIDRARPMRKRLGGSMRQAGVLAAAGLVALEESPKLLPLDHENARFLAEGVASIQGLTLVGDAVETNIVFFEVTGLPMAGAELSGRLKDRGVLSNANGPRLRMVTHRDVDRSMCVQVIDELRSICGNRVGTAA